jgi:hypothetical protein
MPASYLDSHLVRYLVGNTLWSCEAYSAALPTEGVGVRGFLEPLLFSSQSIDSVLLDTLPYPTLSHLIPSGRLHSTPSRGIQGSSAGGDTAPGEAR